MADATGTETTTAIDTTALDQSVQRLNSSLNNMTTSTDKLSNVVSNISNVNGLNTTSIEKQLIDIRELITNVKSASSVVIDSSKQMADAGNKINYSMASRNVESFGKQATGAFQTIRNQFTEMVRFMGDNSSKFKDMFGGGAAVFGAGKIKDFMQTIDQSTKIFTMEERLRGLQQTAMQLNTAMEGVGAGDRTNLNRFNRSVVETMNSTKSLQEETIELKKALGGAFTVEEMDRALSLSKAVDNFKGTLNATNAAMLVSKATGTSFGAVAEFINDSVQNLSQTTEGAVESLGRIQQSSEKSGLGFGKTMEAIKGSADSLKMWGGTVGAAAPLFDAFSRSLSQGQKGLAPQLFEQFASGIKQMGFSMRAFIGLRQGMGGAGGAIGAGLEMEEAMEKGPAGMKKVVDNLTETLKQVGGGRIITRQEAIRDPSSQGNFLLQRQLLMKMIGGDEANATKTIDMLSKIQQTGLDVGEETSEKFGKLIGMGEKVAEQTIPPIQEAEIRIQSAQIMTGGRAIEAAGSLGGRFDFVRQLKDMMTGVDKAIATNNLNPADIVSAYTKNARDKDAVRTKIDDARNNRRQPARQDLNKLNELSRKEGELSAQFLQESAKQIVAAIQADKTRELKLPNTQLSDRTLVNELSNLAKQSGIDADTMEAMKSLINAGKKIELPEVPRQGLPQELPQEKQMLPTELPRKEEHGRSQTEFPRKEEPISRIQNIEVENLSANNMARNLVDQANKINTRQNTPQFSTAIEASTVAKQKPILPTREIQAQTRAPKVEQETIEIPIRFTVKVDGAGNLDIKKVVEDVFNVKYGIKQ